jgi:hypothetical protein
MKLRVVKCAWLEIVKQMPFQVQQDLGNGNWAPIESFWRADEAESYAKALIDGPRVSFEITRTES